MTSRKLQWSVAQTHVHAGLGQPVLDHLALLGAHLPPGPVGDIDVEEVGGDDQRLVVAVEVELEGVRVVAGDVEPAAEGPQPLGQPLALVVLRPVPGARVNRRRRPRSRAGRRNGP